MLYAPGQSGNRAGRAKGQRTAATLKRDAKLHAIRAIGPHAGELVAMGVQRALAGNSDALNGCLVLLATLAGSDDSDPKKPGKPASNSQRQVLADGSTANGRH